MPIQSPPLSTRPSPRRLAAVLAASLGTMAVVAQTPLLDFQFNEGTGSVTSSPTNSLTGTLGVPILDTDVTVVTDTPSGAGGDRAVQFAGGGFLLVDDSDTPVLALNEPMTLEAWVKHDGTSDRQYEGIMAYGGSYKLGLNNGELLFTLFGVVDVPSALILPPDEWHHVAAAWEPGVGVTFYLDGFATFVEATGALRPFGNSRFSIGAEGLATTFLGTIDRVRVHKGLLTDTDLDSVAATPKAPLANTVVSYTLNEAAAPFQNSATAVRPANRGDEYVNQSVSPRFVKDSPTGGDTDYCVEFPAGGQRVTVPDPDATLRLDTGSFTAQAWVKFGPQAARAVLFFNSGPGCAFSFSILDRKLFVTTLGIVDQPSNAAIPDDGGWHHVAVVHESGKELRFYVDGILGDTVPYTGNVLIDVRTDTQFYIGSEPTGGLPYAGKLDRLSVINGIVPAEQLDFRPVPGVDPGAPELTIQTVVEVSWPTLPAGYKLQSTTDAGNPASWTDVATAPTAGEGSFKYYAPVTEVKTFYRLIKP